MSNQPKTRHPNDLDLKRNPGIGQTTRGIDQEEAVFEDEEGEMFPKLREQAADRIAALGSPDELEAAVEADGDDEQALKGEVSGRGQVSDDLTRDELYEKAKDAGIEGRSSMTKDELKDALSKN